MPVGLGIMFIEHFLIYLLFLMTKHDFSFNHHHILVKETSLLPCFIDVVMEVRQFRLIAPESHTVTETIQVIWLQISSSFCTFKSIFWWANGIKTKKVHFQKLSFLLPSKRKASQVGSSFCSVESDEKGTEDWATMVRAGTCWRERGISGREAGKGMTVNAGWDLRGSFWACGECGPWAW